MEDGRVEWRFHGRERVHRIPSQWEGALVAKALKHFLHDGKTGDDVVDRDERLQVERTARAKDFDPDRGIDQDHRRARTRTVRSPRISLRFPSQAPEPASSKI